MTLDAELPQECMANHIKFTGDVLLFDTACYHTAMPNVGGRDRRAVIELRECQRRMKRGEREDLVRLPSHQIEFYDIDPARWEERLGPHVHRTE